MTKTKLLISWIGHTDLRAMLPGQSKIKQEKLACIVGNLAGPTDGKGPIRTLLNAERFDEVHLLGNFPDWVNQDFAAWVGHGACAHSLEIKNPTDYGEIFQSADKTLKQVLANRSADRAELSILLSPGTPAMAAVWVLLGKSKYPARFLQTFEGKAWETTIPFDLAVDFVPELLHDADSLFHQLASRSPQEVEGFERIVGNSGAIRLAVGRARKSAMRDVPVLLLGESGTGKEMFARAIHAASRRKNGPFVAINCAAIPRELIESELFGHVRGAFTGADRNRNGALKQADGGTLFLDEVGELAPDVQAKLLRVLQPPVGNSLSTREYQPLGAAKPERSDVRLISATNRNLIASVGAGSFREDLYYRLAVITITLPALRDRKSDLPALAKAFLDEVNRDFEAQEPGYKYKSLSTSAISFVKQYDWPGNVRQLANVLLQAAVMSEAETLSRVDLESAVTEFRSATANLDVMEFPLGDGFSLTKHLERIHRHFLTRAMRQAGGVKTRAATLLGIENYQTLDAQLRRLGVEREARP
jgi:transcriptional regulator with PAS, ATPase and Fis domain